MSMHYVDGTRGVLKSLPVQHGTLVDVPKTFLTLKTLFSEAKYNVVADFFHLTGTPEDLFAGWDDLAVPAVLFPTSVVRRLSLRTMEAFVSPGSVVEPGNEAAATGLFHSGTFQTLVSLFGGILHDKPEHLSLSLRRIGYSFLSYDGKSFSRRSFPGPIGLANGIQGVGDYVERALKVHEYTFALLLEGYYGSVELYFERSVDRGETGNGDPNHRVVKLPVPPHMGRPDCLSTQGWHKALEAGYEARAFFRRAHLVQSNPPAEKGLARLFESLAAWPPVQRGAIQLLLPTTIADKTEQIVRRREMALHPDPQPDWRPQFPGVFPLTAQKRKATAVDLF
ncbi:hypothetical protein B0H17DRAFT_1206085 [Mycena rosella]|uniref:Uncharacterized protein n=1 Tax=Mycena rosella TaxID=1033263 RepID=A0AAD7D6D4_MYCRO|nr:hypothetical protein B0H17DRAFT_1206085 [Mycena rosella]